MSRRLGYVGRTFKRLSGHTRRFICISEYVAGLVKSYGVAEDKLAMIHCATQTDVRKEQPSTLRQELGIEPEELVFGSTGIWRPNKGFEVFLEAADELHRWQPRIRFLLGGQAYGPDSAYASTVRLEGQLLEALGFLKYTGFQEDVGRFMSALDVFVLPSECEPFGLVLIEAMARGIPVIATRAGGVPEIVVPGETGLLVPPKDADALMQAMETLHRSPMLRMKLGANAKRRAQQYFDQKAMVQKYEDLYTRILTEQP